MTAGASYPPPPLGKLNQYLMLFGATPHSASSLRAKIPPSQLGQREHECKSVDSVQYGTKCVQLCKAFTFT